jgi:hypothetical protein
MRAEVGAGSVSFLRSTMTPAEMGSTFSSLLTNHALETQDPTSARAFSALGMFGRTSAVAFKNSEPATTAQANGDMPHLAAPAVVPKPSNKTPMPENAFGQRWSADGVKQAATLIPTQAPTSNGNGHSIAPVAHSVQSTPVSGAARMATGVPADTLPAFASSTHAPITRPGDSGKPSDINLVLSASDGILKLVVRGVGADAASRDDWRRRATLLASEYGVSINDFQFDGVPTPSSLSAPE